ncbi:MAG TPA: hypothetical protein VHO25_17745, partial [Polyangiaceae bacterium]|nr:hypothetical protein [Polyangiaceae bacterium]
MAGRNRRRSRHGVLLVVLALTVTVVAVGQSNPRTQLQLQPTDDLSGLVGKPVARIEIVALGERWAPTKPLTR